MKDLILFLCKLLWECIVDGENPNPDEWEILRTELFNRDIDPDTAFPY